MRVPKVLRVAEAKAKSKSATNRTAYKGGGQRKQIERWERGKVSLSRIGQLNENIRSVAGLNDGGRVAAWAAGLPTGVTSESSCAGLRDRGRDRGWVRAGPQDCATRIRMSWSQH